MFEMLLSLLLTATQPLSGILEIPGDALIKGYGDLSAARKSAKYLGLRKALSSAWDKLPPDLFTGLSTGRKATVRRTILARHRRYFVGMGQVTERLLPGNTLQWAALYRVDLSRIVGEVKRLTQKSPSAQKTLKVFPGALSVTQRADLAALFIGTLWRPRFDTGKKKPRCPKKETCLQVTLPSALTEPVSLRLFSRRRTLLTASLPRLPGKPIFQALPAPLLAKLNITPAQQVVVRVDAALEGTQALSLLYLLQLQEPALLGMGSFSLGHSGVTARFLVTSQVKRATLLSGVFLGEHVKITRTVGPDVITLSLEIAKTPESAPPLDPKEK